MAHRQVTALTGAVVALVLAACGDGYQRGAGVYTDPTSSSQPEPVVTTSVTPPTATEASVKRAQSTDATGSETGEAPQLTPAQQRDVRDASRAARTFLRGYLPYSYGKGDAREIRDVDPALRDELARRPPRVPPALSHRARPRLKRLRVSGTARGAVYLFADIDDSDASYTALVEARLRDDRWVVVGVQ